jgi:hypothetical protein
MSVGGISLSDLASDPIDQDVQPDAGAPGQSLVATGLTPSEESVQFINAEVLDPPTQGNLSFVKPFADQVAVMVLEDGRSFLQGVEQVLVVTIAKAFEKILADNPTGAVALGEAQGLMAALPVYLTALADAAVKVRESTG